VLAAQRGIKEQMLGVLVAHKADHRLLFLVKHLLAAVAVGGMVALAETLPPVVVGLGVGLSVAPTPVEQVHPVKATGEAGLTTNAPAAAAVQQA